MTVYMFVYMLICYVFNILECTMLLPAVSDIWKENRENKQEGNYPGRDLSVTLSSCLMRFLFLFNPYPAGTESD